jgi:3-oxoacyl-[acyl-carrier-protein] synthase-1
LACSLGLSVEESLATLRCGAANIEQITLPGALADSYPFHAIPTHNPDWKDRARDLVRSVVAEAGAAQMPGAALFIATSSFGIGAVERGAPHLDCGLFADEVAGWLGWSGPVYAISTACTSCMNALLAAQAVLDSGAARDALVLGIELDNRLTASGFAALQLLSATGSRPFGLQRDGLVLGEAVAALRLSVDGAGDWRLLGGATVVDGEQPTGASVPASVLMYRQALAASGLESAEVDLIKVQAAGSPGNDAVEAQALRETFAVVPPLVSFKAAMGHTMGAAGAAEIALLTACLEQQVWPTYPYAADDGLGIGLAQAMPVGASRIMATILGFGGSHASVVLERAA